jgi:flagellar hook-associated protein 1
MLGIFGTLGLATRSLSAYQLGAEVTGHNLANVHNPAYARQRIELQTSTVISSDLGSQGTGVEVAVIRQLRDALLDRQIQTETSVRGWLEAQQQVLQYAQAGLGQSIDRQATGMDGTAANGGVGGQHGLADGISGLFNAWQSLSANPTSATERQLLVTRAQALATQFNQTSERLAQLNTALNDRVREDAESVNRLLQDIAQLNGRIVTAEVHGNGAANDLRDLRLQRMEDLARLVQFTAVQLDSGALDLVIGGEPFISSAVVIDQLETYDRGDGQLLLRSRTAGTPVQLTGGAIQGTIDARDGALASLRGDLDLLAATLVTEVNSRHMLGYDLNGNTGRPFFDGADARSLRVADGLVADPSRVQAAAASGAPGDNRVALGLAQLGSTALAALGNQTFQQHFGQTVARVGQSLASANFQLENQAVVEGMLQRQREAVSGVSLDEEMASLIMFQRAFQASARLVSTLDEMLATVVTLGN